MPYRESFLFARTHPSRSGAQHCPDSHRLGASQPGPVSLTALYHAALSATPSPPPPPRRQLPSPGTSPGPAGRRGSCRDAAAAPVCGTPS